ncbi:MAG: hypothetical protein V3W20_14325 [Candidatus Neomarinimicrobiota bacterium]
MEDNPIAKITLVAKLKICNETIDALTKQNSDQKLRIIALKSLVKDYGKAVDKNVKDMGIIASYFYSSSIGNVVLISAISYMIMKVY